MLAGEARLPYLMSARFRRPSKARNPCSRRRPWPLRLVCNEVEHRQVGSGSAVRSVRATCV